MKTIRNYTTFSVCKNPLAPIIFLGLPLKLSFIFITSFVTSVMLALILGSLGVSSLWVRAIISLSFAGVTMGGVTIFYKKFGIKGFHLYQKDKMTENEIIADKSIIRILKSKTQ